MSTNTESDIQEIKTAIQSLTNSQGDHSIKLARLEVKMNILTWFAGISTVALVGFLISIITNLV